MTVTDNDQSDELSDSRGAGPTPPRPDPEQIVPGVDVFNPETRLAWATAALREAGEAAKPTSGGEVPADLAEPTGWRWRVLADLHQLSANVSRDYDRAKAGQQHQAWESRFGGPLATGGGAAIGSVMSAIGAGLIKTNHLAGWVIVVLGVVLAIAGAVFSANNYVRNRNQRLRFLRLLHDIWDFAYLVLTTAAPADAFAQLGQIRTEWETAGN